jgi:hypothetical protein
METDPLLPEMAVDFVQTCKRTGRKLLGVDRLFLREGQYILDLEAIADFTMSPDTARDPDADADAACEFIRSITTKDSVFTITVE